MNTLIALIFSIALLASCGNGENSKTANTDPKSPTENNNSEHPENGNETVVGMNEEDQHSSTQDGGETTDENPASFQGGIQVEWLQKGSGKTIKMGELLLAHIKHYAKPGEFFINTYKGEPQPILIAEPQFPGDIMEVFARMRKGSEAKISVPAKSLYRNGKFPPGVKEKDVVYYEVKAADIKTKEAFEAERRSKSQALAATEAQRLSEFVKQKGWNVTTTASGLMYLVEKTGNGPKPKKGKDVSVHYTGTLLDGTKFDSSRDRGKPLEFPLGEGRVIRGWDEGIALMNVGSKYKLIIPSRLAYGDRSPGPQIPANSPLVFDVELMGIK